MVVTGRNKSGFYIEVGCPGCGGDLHLDDDFFVTVCGHCGSALRVLMPDTPAAFLIPTSVSDSQIRFHIDRYLKGKLLPLTGTRLHIKRLYYPYWKVDATVLKVRNRIERKTFYSETDSSYENVVENNRADISLNPYTITLGAGVGFNGIPDTLGVRSEAIKVVPYSQENIADGFDSLPVVQPLEIVQRKVRLAVAMLSDVSQAEFGSNLTRLFNPVYSMIYFPYIMAESYDVTYRRFVLDGLTGRVLGWVSPDDDNSQKKEAASADLSLRMGRVGVTIPGGTGPPRLRGNFVDDSLKQRVSHDPMAIPIDGDRPPEPVSITFGRLEVTFHRCGNCGFDLPSELSHLYICGNCHERQMLDRSSCLLAGIHMAAYRDTRPARLVPFWWLRLADHQAEKFANLAGGIDRSDRLVIPALKSANFEAINRLARRMSAAQGRMNMAPVESLDERFMPVSIGLPEALTRAAMLVCHELVKRGQDIPDEDLELQPVEVGLFYVPFHLESYFYVDSVMNAVSLEKTLVD